MTFRKVHKSKQHAALCKLRNSSIKSADFICKLVLALKKLEDYKKTLQPEQKDIKKSATTH